MKQKKDEHNPYLYDEILCVEIHLHIHYKKGGQVGKDFKSIEDVAEFFKEQPDLRKEFTRAGQQKKADAGEDLDNNF